jgi:hypothetical protein
MKKIFLISILFLSLACKGQSIRSSCNWDSLSTSIEEQLDRNYYDLEQKRHVLNDLISIVNRLQTMENIAKQDYKYEYANYLHENILMQKYFIETLKQQFSHN